MKINKLLLAAVMAGTVGTSITSCSNDFLQEDLTTQYSTQRFNTQDGLDELVTGTYQKLKFKFNYIWGIEMYNLGVDEFTDANNPVPSFNCYSADLNSAENGANAPLWDNMYGGIESANTLIQNIPLYYDKTNTNYNTRLGEGYFLRAYFYQYFICPFFFINGLYSSPPGSIGGAISIKNRTTKAGSCSPPRSRSYRQHSTYPDCSSLSCFPRSGNYTSYSPESGRS